ncbi:MAG: hypothetical protein HZB39_13360 [Planctomycetes bacterium]|nr:hypothetical protein [Planctomycetota bacterium]
MHVRSISGFTAGFAAWLTACLAAGPADAQTPSRYVADFEFLVKTIRERAAIPKQKGVGFEAVAAAMRPRFAACTDDTTHVRNAMELLAALKDSHTGITHTGVTNGLPGKFDGLYGGGLWFCFDRGRWVVRGVMDGHGLADRLPLGAVLVAIDGLPAWFALDRERRRVARFLGISSDHSFWASLGNRLLPFCDAQTLACRFGLPDGSRRDLEVPRWGPGGKAFMPRLATFPEGVAHADGAVSKLLETSWSKQVGWLAITGSMDDATVRAFHAAFDALKGMDALLLDCRGMGGGGDRAAWEMCGRLFDAPVANGSNGRIEPSGSWQFDGPVVMLQDELEVSSAETFTWALAETGRVVSVGRNTGGWAIIPNGFDAPSGLFSFRLGVTNRRTPIRGIETEGVGWPPDCTIPCGPVLCARADSAREVGLAALACLHAGAKRNDVGAAFHALGDGDTASFTRFAKALGSKVKGVGLDDLAKSFDDDLVAEVAMERALAQRDGGLPPDAIGLAARASRTIARAKAAGRADLAKAIDAAVNATRAEAEAQRTLLAFDDPTQAPPDARKAWLAKHRATATAAFVREKLWTESAR